MRTIIKKSTGQYLKYMNGEFYTSEIPGIISGDATLDSLTKYAKIFDNVDLDVSDVEIKNCKIVLE